MFDTNLVVVGNVLAPPEWRRFEESGSVVANFRVASTSRRFDRESNTWVDGNSLRVRVTAWRRLADSVISSVKVGDPVIVYGRLYTRDWKDDDGNQRLAYEMEAFSIGHNLAKGTAQFVRNRSKGLTTVEDLDEGTEAPQLPIAFGTDEFAEISGAIAPEPSAAEELAIAPEPSAGEELAIASEPPADEQLAIEVEQLAADQAAPARRGRRPRKEPVAA
ncbi:single-stranded DNA-binding protein [Actinoplanes solisilvae]|uniref:single-stranded DNA-binding protein n=1 Tax=Actinoplanes solisilvae TaxID=2486853 RepID=UPI000FD91CC1|nr:single-stranded DNA-binding protein [Actinoplanes solisilvae]